ncbi:CaiB/BaiF CoA-transferase family protein [Cupriavidus taiwanensis]|uniref:L-carnitine dehydratase/bile acid-inducible protein F n=1 Tax=Cupriavidus taiwanensis TaxID=164546 RepID=A0A375GYE6_9BURK|nr:CaiB/BaiF CoA-transferase family protein [Cupriavidus taiwanensis]SOY42766.1 L-carnitine dehydratase/bile acid-inducible protein F [Cupriavidus taiwanensis]SOY58864.1 L-carnitine dehydratase/bile acid-inducible protein F [Cupriavidus taiwanensis]SOY80097.1 L-carnitine dehydratase/bile acid-inducible protein F [Cupriavidus taiwanensis]SOZ26647.1 L-carnitine dehydratase/bile acid-inducible protein F [Cupriavidus taiwanensis]SOZ50867.1 L-carnitine dehydratase/bile acid-inducible protein F [Cup
MLTGFRVLDITQIVAGPTCTRILAEMGAEVVKLELAPFGDRTRVGGLRSRKPEHKRCSQSTYFVQHNHSKKSLALNLKDNKARELVLKMIPQFDVLVENFSPGVMDRFGLGYDVLKTINPRLVMCSISLAGQKGVLASKPGYDYVAQAYAGITDLIGDAEGSPALITMAIGDASTGVAAAMAIGFALLHRERTGEGQYLETSLLDTYFNMHEVAVPRVSLRQGYEPTRTGSQHPDGGPTGIFRCGDGTYLTLATLPHQWEQVALALGRDDLLTDPRFATAALRRDNNDQLKEIVESWLATFASRDAAIEALERQRIPCAPVLTLREAMNHPHLRERGVVRAVRDPYLGEFQIPGPAARFSAWEYPSSLKADLLGEHNEQVLKAFAGLEDAEIDALYAEGVLVRDRLLEPNAVPTAEAEVSR